MNQNASINSRIYMYFQQRHKLNHPSLTPPNNNTNKTNEDDDDDVVDDGKKRTDNPQISSDNYFFIYLFCIHFSLSSSTAA